MLYYRVICIKLLPNGILSAWLANSLHAIRAHIVSNVRASASVPQNRKNTAEIGQLTAHSLTAEMNELECK